jgi:ubiquitin C-terminal hydrolase
MALVSTIPLDVEIPYPDYIKMLQRQGKLAISATRTVPRYAEVASEVFDRASDCYLNKQYDTAFILYVRCAYIFSEAIFKKQRELDVSHSLYKYSEIKKKATEALDQIEKLQNDPHLLKELHTQLMQQLSQERAARERIIALQHEQDESSAQEPEAGTANEESEHEARRKALLEREKQQYGEGQNPVGGFALPPAQSTTLSKGDLGLSEEVHNQRKTFLQSMEEERLADLRSLLTKATIVETQPAPRLEPVLAPEPLSDPLTKRLAALQNPQHVIPSGDTRNDVKPPVTTKPSDDAHSPSETKVHFPTAGNPISSFQPAANTDHLQPPVNPTATNPYSPLPPSSHPYPSQVPVVAHSPSMDPHLQHSPATQPQPTQVSLPPRERPYPAASSLPPGTAGTPQPGPVNTAPQNVPYSTQPVPMQSVHPPVYPPTQQFHQPPQPPLQPQWQSNSPQQVKLQTPIDPPPAQQPQPQPQPQPNHSLSNRPSPTAGPRQLQPPISPFQSSNEATPKQKSVPSPGPQSTELRPVPPSPMQLASRTALWLLNDNAYNPGEPRRGLVNLGNTCYLNSVSQCLRVTSLGQYFTTDDYIDSVVDRYTGGGRVANTFTYVMRELGLAESAPVSASHLKKAVAQSNDTFAGFSQQDANEFLRTLVDLLHEDLNAKSKTKAPSVEIDNVRGSDSEIAQRYWEQYVSRNESIVVKLMAFQERSTIKCLSCNGTTRSFMPTMSIEVPIPALNRSISIEDCLAAYVTEELLDAASLYSCDRCKRKTRAAKSLAFFGAPQTLVITLKRFKSYGNYSNKVNTPVMFQRTLDFSPYMCGSPSKRSGSLYQLVGIVNHQGNIHGGHYTADARSPRDGVWFSFSDEVFRQSASGPNHQLAYILFYELIPTTKL